MSTSEIAISAAQAGKTVQKLLKTGYGRARTTLKQAHPRSQSRDETFLRYIPEHVLMSEIEITGFRAVKISRYHNSNLPVLPDLLSKVPTSEEIGSVIADRAYPASRSAC